MTDINNLVQNVIDREKAKFDEVIAEFEGQTKAETEKEKDKLKQEFVARKANIEKDYKRQSDISHNSISLRKRDKVLGVKRDLINRYIQDLEISIANLDQTTVKEFIQAILAKYKAEENIVIILGSKTKELLGKTINELTAGFTVAEETIEGQVGLIVQQGSLQYNYLFNNLINNSKAKLEALVINEVFK